MTEYGFCNEQQWNRNNGGGQIKVTKNDANDLHTANIVILSSVNPGYGFHVPGKVGGFLYIGPDALLYFKDHLGRIYKLAMDRVV